MKIRTDFVTNSSSSSFISYQLDLTPLGTVCHQNNMKLKLYRNSDIRIYQRDNILVLKCEKMDSLLSLPQMLIAVLSADDEYCEYEEYEELDPGYLNEGSADYSTYQLQSTYDGSSGSILQIVYELYTNTDLFSHMIVEEDYSHGGSEYFISPKFCHFKSSGEHIITRSGKIRRYYAHPYFGGSSYRGDENAFISYSDGRVSLYDRPMNYEQLSVIWDDKTVAKALSELANEHETNGLLCIEHLECQKLENLLVPESCKLISSNALLQCSALKKIYIPSFNTKLAKNAVASNVIIVAHLNSNAHLYAKTYGNPFLEYDNTQEERIYTLKYDSIRHSKESSVIFNKDKKEFRLSDICRCIERTDTRPILIFDSPSVKIPENVIQQDAVMYVFSGSTAHEYALSHGIEFYTFDDTTYDPDLLPKNVFIQNEKLCAKSSVSLRLNGLTEQQLSEIRSGEKLELLPEPDEMNDLRLVFRNEETGEYRGMLAYRAAYASYWLIKKGYLRFTDIIHHNNGYITASILWEEPLTEQTKRQLHFYQLLQERAIAIVGLMWLSDFVKLFSAAFEVAKIEDSYSDVSNSTNCIASLYESGNRLSYYSVLRMFTGLSALVYNRYEHFEIEYNSRYEIYIDEETQKPVCLIDGKPTALTPSEEEYARVYINHYRKIYYLPPIIPNGGDQNGTV